VPQPLVLAIEPDLRQAAIVKRIVREKVLADVVVVDSPDAALAAMRTKVPDVLLLSALLSPRDEDELVAHLRTLEGAEHLQTHTIPLLASALGPGEGRATRGLLAAFRRKKEPEPPPSGCDPDMFAEEIRVFIQRAADQKRERSNAPRSATTVRLTDAAAVREEAVPTPAQAGPASASCSSWASPFEWKPSNHSALISNPYSRVVNQEPVIEAAEAAIAEAVGETPQSEPVVAEPETVATKPVLMTAEPAAEAPIHVATPVCVDAPIHVAEEPAHVEIPVYADAPIHIEELIHAAPPVEDAVPVQEPAPVHEAVPMRDSGCGMRDSGFGISDKRLGHLASWMRTERAPASASASPDDLRALLGALAVPTAVVAVGYGTGCRIRRVRVPAVREPKVEASAGAVILSRRLLAELRDRREQPRT